MTIDLQAAVCRDPHHCVTCGDDGVEMVVTERTPGGLARCVAEAGEPAEVDLTLVEPVPAGARVLVHAGVAIARLEDPCAS